MSKRSSRPIVERLLSGEEYDLAKIDDEIRAWHETETTLQIHQWLGLTREEYALYVEKPESIRLILAARHQRKPLKKLMLATSGKALLAARGATAKEVEDLRQWLITTGRT